MIIKYQNNLLNKSYWPPHTKKKNTTDQKTKKCDHINFCFQEEHCHANFSYWTLHGLWYVSELVASHCLCIFVLQSTSEMSFLFIMIINPTLLITSRPDKGMNCNSSWHFNSSEIQVKHFVDQVSFKLFHKFNEKLIKCIEICK